MATLTIRNIPDHVREALRVDAAKTGRSMEEALRQLVTKAAIDAEARTSRIGVEEIMRRAAELESDPPTDSRYRFFSQKELSDAICGEYENL